MIGFQLLDIWSKFHRKAIVSYYTDSCACGNKSGKTERSVHGVETSGKLKACLTAHALSHLTHLAWENVTTVCGLCLYAVLWSMFVCCVWSMFVYCVVVYVCILCVVYVCMLCVVYVCLLWCGLCLYAVVWSMFVCCGVVYVCML